MAYLGTLLSWILSYCRRNLSNFHTLLRPIWSFKKWELSNTTGNEMDDMYATAAAANETGNPNAIMAIIKWKMPLNSSMKTHKKKRKGIIFIGKNNAYRENYFFLLFFTAGIVARGADAIWSSWPKWSNFANFENSCRPNRSSDLHDLVHFGKVSLSTIKRS